MLANPAQGVHESERDVSDAALEALPLLRFLFASRLLKRGARGQATGLVATADMFSRRLFRSMERTMPT